MGSKPCVADLTHETYEQNLVAAVKTQRLTAISRNTAAEALM